MKRRALFLTCVAVVAGVGWMARGPVARAQTASSPKEKKFDFDREIRPILSDNCFACHGPDEQQRMVDLRLDTKEGMFADRGGYQVIVLGNAGASRLYQRISAPDKALRMPPPTFERSLTDQQVELIRQWIDQGAEYKQHWAFIAPTRPPRPEVRSASWPRNEIDYFVLARLEREGLKPSPEADKATLLRRVTLDLTGLPPTPAEVDAFLADKSPDAYERKVDELLRSPHYGERMAMPWLDLARYADTHGYHIDSHRDMWRWRNWVINAYNRNLPFDQFTIEQLAGDLLPNATPEQKLATGFNRNHVINFEGGAIPEEYQNEYVVDRIETTSAAWLGLTMGCARCHDHKYDPLKQKDFYSFYAFFNTIPEKGLDGVLGNAGPLLQLPLPEQAKQLEELKQKVAAAKAGLPDAEVKALQANWEKTAAQTIPEALGDGLVAYYEFEKDLADSTGQGQAGKTLRGGVSYDFGAVGKTAEFSGEAHVELGEADTIDPSQPFSLAFWYTPGSRFDMGLLQKLDSPETRRGFEILLDEGVWLGGPQKRASNIIVRITHRWPDQAIEVKTKQRQLQSFPRHLTITHDGSGKAAGLRLYLDAKPLDLDVLHDTLAGSVQNYRPLEIGNTQLGRAYKGQLDDFRIYRRVLASGEMEQLAVHQPIRAIVAGASGACAEADAHPEKPKLLQEAGQDDDPVALQSQQDTRAYRVGGQCYAEKEKLEDYLLTWAAPDQFKKSHAALKELGKQKEELDKAIPTSMVMEEMKKPRETFLLVRGDYRRKGEPLTPGVPIVLPPLPTGAPADRLGLAKWLVDSSHPLTARVVVNRYWQMYFGVGLVKTAEDFGAQGEPPSHPEMLDWLATEFIRTGWDVRAMQRLIVTSATYRQASRVTPELLEMDAENRLLARGPRFRLPAEFVRDNALAASGLLNTEIGGPSVFPYQPAGLWEEMAFGDGFSAQEYTTSRGKDLYRRSMYTFWKRTVPPAALSMFDAPDREKCTARRAVTNTPLQALVLLNDPTYVEAARALAERTLTEAGRKPEKRIAYAFRRATARHPDPREVKILKALAQRELAHYRRDKNAALELLGVGDSPANPKLDATELAAWTTVASAILNLDETVTKE